ncbi:hypothetical protein Cgig2_017236 [Carnegiea gigantea]|uniref:Uncharacterized protein n=1 Tax=Carnegiea gigantea TaxID=171969 RepID=A0A9Q1GSH1_9CARY|nr:hypothetical protein Cgig2_017236 [Carnegiea gigantea]
MSQGLSDHTPLLFPLCPRPKSSFLFCDMWVKGLEFDRIVIVTVKALPDNNKRSFTMILKNHNWSTERKIVGQNTYLLFTHLYLSSGNKVNLFNYNAVKVEGFEAVLEEDKMFIGLKLIVLLCRSPSLNGYSNGPFNAYWSSIGSLVCDAFCEFFDTSVMPKFFSDDLTLFYKVDLVSLKHLMHAFHMFSCCSGLTANLVKFQIITSFNEESLPFRHLGVPIIARLSKVKGRALVNTIMAKLKL